VPHLELEEMENNVVGPLLEVLDNYEVAALLEGMEDIGWVVVEEKMGKNSPYFR
jgi:hypothetical protein